MLALPLSEHVESLPAAQCHDQDSVAACAVPDLTVLDNA